MEKKTFKSKFSRIHVFWLFFIQHHLLKSNYNFKSSSSTADGSASKMMAIGFGA